MIKQRRCYEHTRCLCPAAVLRARDFNFAPPSLTLDQRCNLGIMKLQIRVLGGSPVPGKLEADPNGTLVDFYDRLLGTGLISTEKDARYRLVRDREPHTSWWRVAARRRGWAVPAMPAD